MVDALLEPCDPTIKGMGKVLMCIIDSGIGLMKIYPTMMQLRTHKLKLLVMSLVNI